VPGLLDRKGAAVKPDPAERCRGCAANLTYFQVVQSLWPYHHLEGFAIVRVAMAAGHSLEIHDMIEDASGLNPANWKPKQSLIS
jgi:hypothetical protein